MKRILLLLLLCVSSAIAMAQTTWTGLGANTNWDNTDNWDTNLVPTATDDVIIPTGFTVTLNVPGIVKSIDLQGTSVFEINTNFSFLENSTFGANSVTNWSAGILSGSTSTLSSQGELNLIGNSNKTISPDTTVDNEGTLNITSSGDLFISGTGATLNNLSSGVIDLQSDSGNINWSGSPGVINNTGLIKKTLSVGEAQIITSLNNNNGTIQVEDGTLSFQSSPKNFVDGTYNVFASATLDWDTTIIISGNMEGTLSGEMNWNSSVTIADGDLANLNFIGGFNWTGVLGGNISGGGILTNNDTMSLTSNSTKVLTGGTTLNNSGVIIIASGGDMFINSPDTTLNNLVSATIDMQFDAGNITWSGAPGTINNSGTIKKTMTTGESQIFTILNNNDGTIQVEDGTLSFQSSIKNFINGTYNVFSGATLDWDTPINISGSLGGAIDGTMNWNSSITIADGDSADLNFAENFNWTGLLGGNLSGGGTLTNNGKLNLISNSAKILTGNTTFNNLGEIVISAAGDLFINLENTILNNQVGGVIDMQFNGGNITWSGESGVINNFGLIKKTTSTGEAQIIATLNNNDGTIQVEEGILSFQSSVKNFQNGTYNVFANATLDWDTPINISGSLEGTIDGNMDWNSSITIAEGDQADLNFAENFNWLGILGGSISGGGTLTNNGQLNLTSNSAKILTGGTTFNNAGEIVIASGGDLFITVEDTTLNNLVSGVIDMQFDAGNITWSGVSGTINNFGLLRRSLSTGVAQVFVDFNNFGVIEVATGELEMTGSRPFTNQEGGIVKGIGIFDLPLVAGYTNNGIFAPGLSPGTLSVQGDYTSTSTSQLDIELNGLIPDSEHDVLDITGNNIVFEGDVNISMGFEAEIGNAFIIANTTGTIATQNLTTPIIVDYDGKQYTLDVTYPDNNKVLLTISDKLDILPPDVITQNITIQLDASGNASITEAQIDNGSSDNCTLTPNLIFSLDITDFTCADLGVNTVTLTVTDEADNSANAIAIVTVEDIEDPVVTCPADITVNNDLGNCGASVTFMASATDNCAGVTTSSVPSSGSIFPIGTTEVIVTATDASGNTDVCTFNVTVNDGETPTINCPDGFVVDSVGDFTLPDYFIEGDVVANDNCGFTVTQTPAAGTILPDGDYTISYQVTDDTGNTASCSFNLKVIDETLGIDNNQLVDNDISLYPNPVSDSFIIKNIGNITLTKMTIIDVKGSVVQEIDLQSMGIYKTISVQNYQEAVYFIRIESENGFIVKRLIKQ